MTSIIYSSERAKEIAGMLEHDETVNAKDMQDIDPDTDVLGFIVENNGSALPLSIEKYIEDAVSGRDNQNIGYIFAIFLSPSKWAANRMQALLADSGCVLSYHAAIGEESIESIKEDIRGEEFRIPGNGILYRLFRKKLKAYRD